MAKTSGGLTFYHADQTDISPALSAPLRALQTYMGKPVNVISGYRDPVHNRAVGGAKKSYHMHHTAADIDMTGWSVQERISAIQHLVQNGIKGVIAYSGKKANMLHVDLRKNLHFMFDTTDKKMRRAPDWFRALANKIEFKGQQKYATGFPQPPDMSFPAAPPGPTEIDVGPGIHGAGLPAFVNERPTPRPVRAEPQDFSRAAIGGLAKAYHDLGAGLATQGLRGVGGAVAPAASAPLASSYLGAGPKTPMVSGGSVPATGSIFGAGAVTPGMLGEPMHEARPTQSVPTQARVSPPSGNISVASQVPGISMVDRATMASPPPESSLIGPQSRAALGPLGAVTPGMYGAVPATAATEQPAIPDDPRAAALTSMPNTGWTAPPAAKQAPVVAQEEQTVAAPEVGAPVIEPQQQTIEAPFPEAPTPEQINRTKLQGLLEHPLASLGNPFKGLGGIFGGVPTPEKSTHGVGLKAIGDILSGNVSTPGATSYSRSTPGFSVTALGNGVVAKTNQYGVTSFETVGQPGGIFGSTKKSSFGASSFGGWGGGKSGGSWSGSGGKGYGGTGNMSAGSGSLSHSTRY